MSDHTATSFEARTLILRLYSAWNSATVMVISRLTDQIPAFPEVLLQKRTYAAFDSGSDLLVRAPTHVLQHFVQEGGETAFQQDRGNTCMLPVWLQTSMVFGVLPEYPQLRVWVIRCWVQIP